MSGKPAKARFEMTRWSLVLKAAGGHKGDSQKALSELCELYWYPIYSFVRRSGYKHHEAEDMTQGLFLHLTGKDGLTSVSPGKGKFRSFLLAAMKHYMANEWNKATAQKRGGGQKLISIDKASSEDRFDCEPATTDTPEIIYERKWALAIIESALHDLEQEYRLKKKQQIFELLNDHIAGETGRMTYAEIGKQLNISEGNVKIIALRMRRRFNAILKYHVAQTIESEADVEEEIKHMISCL